MKANRDFVRNLTLGIGVCFLAAAGIVYSVRGAQTLWLYMGIAGLLLIGSVVFERSAYRPRVQHGRGHWQMTGERFRDPGSGHMMEVRFNPVTGERDYVEVGDSSR